MKNFYIPELGDKITLSEDWSFTLHGENRNEDLINYFGYEFILYNGICPKGILPKLVNTNYRINYPSVENFKDIFGKINYIKWDEYKRKAENNCVEYQAYLKSVKERNEKIKQTSYVDSINVTLPKDSILTIDRIYIRKGLKDYSSITFWVKIPNVKKKIRFWAKLEDCNKIKFL